MLPRVAAGRNSSWAVLILISVSAATCSFSLTSAAVSLVVRRTPMRDSSSTKEPKNQTERLYVEHKMGKLRSEVLRFWNHPINCQLHFFKARRVEGLNLKTPKGFFLVQLLSDAWILLNIPAKWLPRLCLEICKKVFSRQPTRLVFKCLKTKSCLHPLSVVSAVPSMP